jgi:hypothetical protein
MIRARAAAARSTSIVTDRVSQTLPEPENRSRRQRSAVTYPQLFARQHFQALVTGLPIIER